MTPSLLSRIVPRRAAATAQLPVLGIDFGSRRIKVVALSPSGAQPFPVWAVDEPTPGGVFPAEGGFDSLAAGRVLARLLEGRSASGGRAAITLPFPAVRTHWLRSSPADPAALRRTLENDAELRLPGVDGDAVHYAVSTFDDTPEGGDGDASSVLIAASARKDAIRAYSAAADGAALGSIRVSVPSVALANLHALLFPAEVASPVVVLHGGYGRSELIVLQGGAPIVVFPATVGVEALLDTARRAHPDSTAAEVEARLGSAAALGTGADPWIDRMIGPYRTAVGIAMRSLGTGVVGGPQVGGAALTAPIRISGGLARFRGAWERLGERLQVPCTPLDPSERWPHLGEEGLLAPALSPALGAALEAHAVRALEVRS